MGSAEIEIRVAIVYRALQHISLGSWRSMKEKFWECKSMSSARMNVGRTFCT